MDEAQALEFAGRVVSMATAAGADGVEATVSVARRFHVEARDNAISKLEQSIGKALQMRVFLGGRKATLATSDFSDAGLNQAVRATLAAAAHVAVDELAGLPAEFTTTLPDLDLYDPAIARRDPADKVEEAFALERLIRQTDSRIVNSSGSHYADAVSTTALANSAGFSGSYTSTRASRSTGPVALDGDVKRTAHYGTAGRHAAQLEDVGDVAKKAAQRAVQMFGARKPPTSRLPVIFDRDVASSILEDLFAALCASNVATGNSWLIGRVGTRLGSPLVNIVDDGVLPAGLGSSPFDGEGVATRSTTVFEAGVLQTFLYDTYYGRKLGAASTGNSNGSGIGTNNFYLQAGTHSVEELIAGTPRGVLVLDTIGFATEHASGTYSRGARGIFIENGEPSYPIDEFTIAGDYAGIFAGIDAVANDLRFDSAVVSPSFRVAEMTVSGN